MFQFLNDIQINVLIASIIDDGELTKLYKGSRRKNSSYREHYGEQQREYREWKQEIMDGFFILLQKVIHYVQLLVHFLPTCWNYFIMIRETKVSPPTILPFYNLPHFLAVLYMDDGTLSITPNVNHNSKRIYITPHIYLYLQNYPSAELTQLKEHINEFFQIDLKLAKRKDGHGFILRTTTVSQTFAYLNAIKDVAFSCPTMFYKTNWCYRFRQETQKWKLKYPDYQLIVSSSERNKNYSTEENHLLISLKKSGLTDKEIAFSLGRSYWSVVYKLSELRRLNLLLKEKRL